MHRSRDGGARFEEVAAPRYPPHPEGTHDTDAMGRKIPWSLEQIWVLEGAGGTIWAGGHAAGRALSLWRRRRLLGAGALALGSARAQAVVRRRVRLSRHPLGDPRRPTRDGGRLPRWRLGQRGRRREMG